MRKTSNEELNRLSVDAFREAEKSPVILVLDNIRSLHNVGSAFRTADAFRAEAIFLCGITGTPPDREIRKTALGATETVRWKYFQSTILAITELRSSGYRICSVEQADEALSLELFLPGKEEKLALVFGNEVKGVDADIIALSDAVLEIPQSGTKHSLNVSVSIGIVLWEVSKKLGTFDARALNG
jgi:23S rRNA (guanosine2251-2'-O)-methyltransferase